MNIRKHSLMGVEIKTRISAEKGYFVTVKMKKCMDNNGIGRLVKDLTHIVEDEVKAFQKLLDVLLDQQTSLLEGDILSVSLSNDEVERIVAKTKVLEEKRKGKSQDLSLCFDVEEAPILSRLIPLVEQRYAERLKELKEVLKVLSKKIQNNKKQNTCFIEQTLRFVDQNLQLLTRGQLFSAVLEDQKEQESTQRRNA